MNDLREFGAGRAIDLSQLSEAERRVLRLLAQGHTAKSIAAVLGSTPTAINERLRQARRKTGAGSSREIARLLTAQENRHDKIEMAANAAQRLLDRQAGAKGARFYWPGAAAVIIVLATALSFLYVAEQASTEAAKNSAGINDPIVGVVPSSQFDIDQLYLRLRTEHRDPSWAPQMTEAVRAYLSRIPYVGGTAPLRITCGSSLCEAAGVIVGPETKEDEYGQNSPVNRTMQALQGKDIHDFAASLGLDDVAASFQGLPRKRNAQGFLIYFQRKH